MNKLQEIQKINQKWLWVLLITTELCVIYKYLITRFIINIESLLSIGSITFVLIFIYSIKLRYTITPRAIHIRFFPILLKTKTISVAEIKKINLIQYDAILEYGGWGIKNGKSKKSYTTSGNRAICLELYNGKQILVGTQLDLDFLYNKLIEINKYNQNIIIEKHENYGLSFNC